VAQQKMFGVIKKFCLTTLEGFV